CADSPFVTSGRRPAIGTTAAAPGCPLPACTFVVQAKPVSEEDAMKYLLQIYPHQGPEDWARLSTDEQDALVTEYLEVSRSPGVVDGALDLAARIPAARMGGAVEVRPLVER